MHFIHWNVEDTIVVLNEVPRTHPQCNQCDMLIPRGEMVTGHLRTVMRKKGAEQKRCHLAATATRVEVGTEFQARDQVLEKVETLRYLDRMLPLNNSNWTMVDRNLQRAQGKLGQFSCILCQ